MNEVITKVNREKKLFLNFLSKGDDELMRKILMGQTSDIDITERLRINHNLAKDLFEPKNTPFPQILIVSDEAAPGASGRLLGVVFRKDEL